MIGRTAWITACIPTFGCNQYLRESVTSLLAQTHPFIRVIVINDGDAVSPWPTLSDIADPRLIRFDLGENRGPYFCRAIAAEATRDPFVLVQDADDWSAPTRVERLLKRLCQDRSHFAFSAEGQFVKLANIHRGKHLFSTQPEVSPTHQFKYRVPHHGLFHRSSLGSIGGFFGGFRFGYDLLLMNLLLLVGTVSWLPEVLYWIRQRSDSLSSSASTGLKSAARRKVRSELEGIYQFAYRAYLDYRLHRITGDTLLNRVRDRIELQRGPSDTRLIHVYADRLRKGICAQSGSAGWRR